ncbi:MAG: Tm-1-like ATP-binding domain-containing protein, partial [Tissierellaceae bacterium]
MKTVCIAGTFDTKGKELAYVKGIFENLGLKVFTMDTGVFGSDFPVDVTSGEIVAEIGEDINE